MQGRAPTRPTAVTVNLDALSSNIKKLKAAAAGAELLAVVKANAYGMGAIRVAREALDSGAAWLGVAAAAEGHQLRAAGLESPVLLLGPASHDEAPHIISSRLTPSIFGPHLLEALDRQASSAGCTVAAHLKVDSGMGRLGVRPEELGALLETWKRCPNVVLDGFFSNFASADDPPSPQNSRQEKRFKEMLSAVRAEGFSPTWIHLANSSALLTREESRFTLVRPGLSMYGLTTSDAVPRSGLKEVAGFSTQIIQTKALPAETPVGYSATFVTRVPTRVGILPIGYGDGLPRSLSGVGHVLVRGARCPIVGRVSMDLTAIDLSASQEAGYGDKVVLWGRSGDESLNPWDWARWSGTIPYEITSGISARVARIYIKGGEESSDWPLSPPVPR